MRSFAALIGVISIVLLSAGCDNQFDDGFVFEDQLTFDSPPSASRSLISAT